MRVVCLAKGARDDIQPIVVLAKALSNCNHINIHVCTHGNHKGWVTELLTGTACQTSWLKVSSTTDLQSGPVHAVQSPSAEESVQETLRACVRCFKTDQAADAPDHQHRAKALIVCNPPAIEGVHWADTLGVPCIVVSAKSSLYVAPTSIITWLQDNCPALGYNGGVHVLCCLTAVEHRSSSVYLPATVPLLIGVSSETLPPSQEPSLWPENVTICGSLECQLTPQDERTHAAELTKMLTFYKASLKAKTFAEWQADKPLLCIHFGSAAASGLFPDFGILFRLLTSALERAGAKGVLLTDGFKPLFFDIWMAAAAHSDPILLADASTFPPVHALLPHCSAVLHSGSSRMVAAAAQAGLPQIACCRLEDQYEVSRGLKHAGVAVAWLDLDDLQTQTQTDSGVETAAQKLSDAIQVAVSGDLQQACDNLKAKFAEGPDGLDVAVDLICQHLSSAAVPKLENLHMDDHQDDQDDLDDPTQDYVRMANGWEVTPRAEVEALFIYNEIFKQSCYLKHGIVIKDGAVVVDVGANVGMFVSWILDGQRHSEIPSKVYALEPLQPNLQVLEHNLKKHDLTDKVQVIAKAVGSESGQLQFRYFPTMPGNSTCHVQEKEDLQGEMMTDLGFFEGAQDCICPVTTISQVMRDHAIQQIDLLKVDVEGSELEVLQGVAPQDWPCIRQVVLELHDVGDRKEVATMLLESHGFSVVLEHSWPPQNCMVYAWKPESQN